MTEVTVTHKQGLAVVEQTVWGITEKVNKLTFSVMITAQGRKLRNESFIYQLYFF